MQKTIRVPVALTPEQHKLIADAAGRIGLTISAYMRAVALEKAQEGGKQ